MEIVVAVYSDWGIGCDGTQPLVIPADRKHFREITGSDTVIVGRRTLADFPGGRPLKGRENIILSASGAQVEGAVTVLSADEAAELAKTRERVFVIGGASVYRALLPLCHTAHVTKIDAAPKSDVFFENLDASPEWEETDSSPEYEHEGVKYRFVTYKRKK